MIRWVWQESLKNNKQGSGFDYPKEGIIWVHASAPTKEEMKKISTDFKVPMRLMENYTKQTRSSKHSLKPFSFTMVDYIYEKQIERVNILFVISENFVVTISEKPLPFYEEVFREVVELSSTIKLTSTRILLDILDTGIEKNYDILQKIEKDIASIEKDIIIKKGEGHIERVVVLRRSLNDMSKAFWTSSRITYILKKGVSVLNIGMSETLVAEDLHDALMHQIEIITNQKEMLSDTFMIFQSTISNNLAQISNRINVGIKKLTLITLVLTGMGTLISFPNTIATVFGIPSLGLNVSNNSMIMALLFLSTIIPIVAFLIYWRKRFR